MAPQPIIVFATAINMDLYTITNRLPRRGESVRAIRAEQHTGGKGSNASIAAYRYSRARTKKGSGMVLDYDEADKPHIKVIGAVGDDLYGKQCLENFRANNIDVTGVITVRDHPTGVATLLVEEERGENSILCCPGVTDYLSPSHFGTADLFPSNNKPDLFVTNFELKLNTVEHILTLAQREHIPTLLNPSPHINDGDVSEAVLARLTHIVLNEHEAAEMCDMTKTELQNETGWAAVMDHFLAAGVENVILTLGPVGAYYATASGASGHVPADKVSRVIDSAGAGDTFIGVYSAEYIQQKRSGTWDIEYAVRRACKASARVIQKMGCQVAIPWGDQF